MKKILISGYYGFGNSGDDALLLSIIRGLKEKIPDCAITVLSANPGETAALYGVDAVDRWNIFKIIKSAARSDLLVSGGGTLIQDGTSTKSLVYYLAVIMTAYIFRTKIMLYSNGIGPLGKKGNIRITRNILNKADLITLRDEASEKTLAEIGVTKPKIELTADPAFLLEADTGGRSAELIAKCRGGKSEFFIISIRRWRTLSEDFAGVIAEAADHTAERYGMTPVFLPMQLSADGDISREAAAKMKSRPVMLDERMTTGETLAVIERAKLCIGMRLHTLIYAASRGVPVTGLVYDPKINGFMDYIGQNMYTDVSGVKKEKLIGMIDECMLDYDEIKRRIDGRVCELRIKAEKNSDYAARLLEGGPENGK
ncbi:MAG: polysaccharide pyruvyl transferase CsaB [Oscillospiraceae bacterium]|nr:polysaccharide pyruvyl transferase CsaB [Oscillospiraceae bacterium]